MLPKPPNSPSSVVIKTGAEYCRATVPRVLRHLDDESIELILDAVEQSIEQQGMRFASAQSMIVASGEDEAPEELAAAYLMEYPGRLGSLVGPWVSNRDAKLSEEAAVAVLRSLVRTSCDWKVELVQTVIELDSPYSVKALRLAGFRKLATLYQMSVELTNTEILNNAAFPYLKNRSQESSYSLQPFEWRQYNPSDFKLWIEWLDRTYEETADCPELNGVRATAESFAGYLASSGIQSSGNDTPHWWAAIETTGSQSEYSQCESRIAAAFMLGSSGAGNWELSYMGVVPKYRGRGLATETLRRALHLAQRQDAKQLWLAVDRRNESAIRLYQRFGFEITRELDAWFLPIK
ncbi:MAG: GNAT family N-acetyltransferase [Pirellulaceae bacterium]|nr:GNAT family N-acetyltransferase [Pirellulaceae bacterium]